MNDYRQLRYKFEPCSETATDIAAALLADVGFEMFEPDESGLTAYIRADACPDGNVAALLADFPMDGVEVSLESDTLVEGRDWNAEWERNYFSPIIIDRECAIHASFHTDVPECKYDIVIDPRMAFGTGHHDTTTLIIRRLLAMDLEGLKVADVGTGTGILAILSSMRGASHVDAIEIDEFAYANAVDNMGVNLRENVDVALGDASLLPATPAYDLLIANINRNVILADLPRYAAALKTGGCAVFSGFYRSVDADMVVARGVECGLEPVDINSAELRPDGNAWASVLMRKI